MMVEDVRWPNGKSATVGADETSEVVFTGVVRGRGLKADRLVHVGDWGTFQIDKITAAPLENRKQARGNAMTLDTNEDGTILEQPTDNRDDMAELAPEEILMEENETATQGTLEQRGVLLDNHHYFEDEDTTIPKFKPKRLPRGTSKYQSAWYLEDLSDSGSDLEDIDYDDQEPEFDQHSRHPADGMTDVDMIEPTEGGPSEYPQSEMFLDPSPDDEIDQIAAYRSKRQEEAAEDKEFPDEIELLPNVLARERLARYRGLRNLRTSQWDTDEDKLHEPEEWRRLLEIADYKGAKNRVIKETLLGGVQPGTRVHVHLRGVPLSLQSANDPSRTMGLFSLLRHEQKRTAANFSINLSSETHAPVKSKEDIFMQCGPRRFVINPVFSQLGNTPNDVHKFDRYIHPGQSAQASFIAPLTWGYVPALFFKRTAVDTTIDENPNNSPLTLIGTGTSLPPSQSRAIVKRIILTGHPFKIHKRLVTVRYMFFNSEDVAWFKALQLWTKRGRSGNIRDGLGTHGYFKAMFDGKISPMDAIAVSLYKRVWPRSARVWTVGQDLEVPQLIKVPDE
jgi:pre-rRNA-processing protein TSR1